MWLYFFHAVYTLCNTSVSKELLLRRVVQGNVLFCIRYAPLSGNTALNKTKCYAS